MEVQLHLLFLQSHSLHVGEGEFQVEFSGVIGENDVFILVLLVGFLLLDLMEDTVHCCQLLIPFGFRWELDVDLVLPSCKLQVGLLLGHISEARPILTHVQVLKDASHNELCLVYAAIEVLLLGLHDLVEVQSSQPDGQLDGLVLVVVHDGVVVAFDACLQEREDFHPSQDVLESDLNVLEPAQEEVQAEIEQVAEG